jgi:hypothetical protein
MLHHGILVGHATYQQGESCRVLEVINKNNANFTEADEDLLLVL